MNLVGTVRDLTAQILDCANHEEAIGVLDSISIILETSPIALGFWWLWPPDLYTAYLDAMRVYVVFCLQK